MYRRDDVPDTGLAGSACPERLTRGAALYFRVDARAGAEHGFFPEIAHRLTRPPAEARPGARGIAVLAARGHVQRETRARR